MTTGVSEIAQELLKTNGGSSGYRVVDLKPLKEYALTLDDPLKSLILRQPDTMLGDEFAVKAGQWSEIAKIMYKRQ